MPELIRLPKQGLVLGLMGAQGSGKSALGGILRWLAGVDDFRADLEFSDLMIEVTNVAMHGLWGEFDYHLMRRLLAAATHMVLNRDDQPVPLRPVGRPEQYHLCKSNSSIDCPECGLKEWAQWVTPDLRLTRENKRENRAVLIWLGAVMKDVYGPEIWPDEIAYRIREARWAMTPLVTVGGIRFPGDAAMIRAQRGVIVRVVRWLEEIDRDATNAFRGEVVPDVVVYNTANLSALEDLAQLMHFDAFERGILLPVYKPLAA